MEIHKYGYTVPVTSQMIRDTQTPEELDSLLSLAIPNAYSKYIEYSLRGSSWINRPLKPKKISYRQRQKNGRAARERSTRTANRGQ